MRCVRAWFVERSMKRVWTSGWMRNGSRRRSDMSSEKICSKWINGLNDMIMSLPKRERSTTKTFFWLNCKNMQICFLFMTWSLLKSFLKCDEVLDKLKWTRRLSGAFKLHRFTTQQLERYMRNNQSPLFGLEEKWNEKCCGEGKMHVLSLRVGRYAMHHFPDGLTAWILPEWERRKQISNTAFLCIFCAPYNNKQIVCSFMCLFCVERPRLLFLVHYPCLCMHLVRNLNMKSFQQALCVGMRQRKDRQGKAINYLLWCLALALIRQFLLHSGRADFSRQIMSSRGFKLINNYKVSFFVYGRLSASKRASLPFNLSYCLSFVYMKITMKLHTLR